MKLITGASQGEATIFKSQKKITIALACLAGILVIGDLDYLTGYKTSVIVIYILPIAFATIDVGAAFAILLAVLSIAISLGSDLLDEIPYSEIPTQLLNAAIALTVFIISVELLQALKRILLRRE